jgi:hypothetical protein
MRGSRRTANVKVVARRISKNLSRIGEDFLHLGRAIESALKANASRAGRMRESAPADGRRRRAPRVLTAKDRARLRLQGEYLGLVRHLSARNRGKVKLLRAQKGYPPAISLARRMMKARG